MAAAEEEARQKALKALREKQDMLIAIKERKAEGMLLKYYANDKYKPAVKERDTEGYLPIHWAGEAQCKQNVFEVLLSAFPEGVKEVTNKTKERPGGDMTLHLLCKGTITADTEKAFKQKTVDKEGAIQTLVAAYPEASRLRIKGKLAIHNAARSNTPAGAIEALVDANPTSCQEKEEGDDIGLGPADGNLPLHSACLKKLADGVIEKLVQTYREGAATPNGPGNLPIHYAAEKQCTQPVMKCLLDAFPAGTRSKDERDLMPLQIAAQFQASDEVVGELLRVDKEVTHVKDKLGRYPVRIAFENQGSDGVIDQMLVAFPHAASEKDDVGKLLLHYAAEKQATDSVVQSLLTAYHDGAQVVASSGSLALHYAAQFKASDVVVDIITTANPQAAKALDVAANLPLHLACQYQATQGVVSRLLLAYDDASRVFSAGALPLHFAAAHESSDDVVKVLLQSYPEACRIKDEQGDLPLHLAYKKQLALTSYEKEALQVRKAAELTQAKWHLEGVDVNKFKFQIKEVDDICDDKTAIHKRAKDAVEANQKVIKTLLRATFEVMKSQEQPPEPTMVPAGVLPHVKEKKTMGEWLPLLAEGQSADKKKGNVLAQAVDKLGQIPLHRALIKHAPLDCVKALLETFPGGVKVKDGGEMLPLHLAIQNRASEAVILELITAYPEATGVTEPQEFKLPLHFGCEMVASDTVISELLTVNFLASRESTKSGCLPMHFAAEHDTSDFVMKGLLMANPESCKVKTSSGCLALHRACKTEAPASVVKTLLEFYPAAAENPDVRGSLPVHWAVGKHQSNAVISALMNVYPEGCKVADNDGNKPLHVAIEYEASDETIREILHKYIGACRDFNSLRKLPYDLAREHNASAYVLELLERADKEARDSEVGILAWLWG